MLASLEFWSRPSSIFLYIYSLSAPIDIHMLLASKTINPPLASRPITQLPHRQHRLTAPFKFLKHNITSWSVTSLPFPSLSSVKRTRVQSHLSLLLLPCAKCCPSCPWTALETNYFSPTAQAPSRFSHHPLSTGFLCLPSDWSTFLHPVQCDTEVGIILKCQIWSFYFLTPSSIFFLLW